ncbi:ABC transporter permease subunit, partial [Parafrankia sp. FMc6]|uniref:ABC transporter permease n=1 Tax=Parafrankia soli TaxID=2599596 RepID=UPI0034D3A31E
ADTPPRSEASARADAPARVEGAPRDGAGRGARRLRAWVPVLPAALVVAFALLGPLVIGRSPTAQVGGPFQGPSAGHPLGTDVIGRDVLARLAHGGLPVVALAAGSTLLTSGVGVVVGMATALSQRRTAELVMRVIDLVAVIPGLLLLLVLATGYPGSDLAVLVAVALVSAPFSVRVIRAAAAQVAAAGFVEIARARGDSRRRILRHDLAPNIVRPALAETGLRFSVALHLTATAGFLGLGRAAPAPHWGRMVDENAAGIGLTVWPFLAPVFLLLLLAVSVNLLADRLASRLAGGR